MQLELFPYYDKIGCSVSLDELFDAYFTCRKNKRKTNNALAFEIDYENNLVELLNEINSSFYSLGKSIAFIVNKPVKREIFAANFRDRIVHHLLVNKINHLFEKEFIHDSFACRVGKGTHYGIKRIDHFIRSCSSNYSSDCYILKLDIKAFFMNINRDILFRKLSKFIITKYQKADQKLILDLCEKIIYYDPAKNCIIKGYKTDWDSLPNDKSLFYSAERCGLPIGNLTSQVFANFYMNEFDHFMKYDLKIKYYGRYVDDFVIVHQSKKILKSLVPIIRDFLDKNLKLKLHPNKIYLQHYSKGVSYLGAVIKQNRIYIGNRTKGNFIQAIEMHNQIAENHKPNKLEIKQLQSSVNSYLGLMKHYQTFNIRKKMLYEILSKKWKNFFLTNVKKEKVVIKKSKPS